MIAVAVAADISISDNKCIENISQINLLLHSFFIFFIFYISFYCFIVVAVDNDYDDDDDFVVLLLFHCKVEKEVVVQGFYFIF